jgi:hypothetical protein
VLLPLQLLLILSYTDTYLELAPSFLGRNVGWYVTHGLYNGIVGPLATVLGLKPFYDEYTPERLMGIRKQLESGKPGRKAV